jgi:alpha-L-fucosidase
VQKLTLSPEPGEARKEILFTSKGRTVYAILPKYPQGTLTIRELRPVRGARISLLGSRHADLEWRQKGRDVIVTMPRIADGELPFAGAWTLRIESAVAQTGS